MLRKTLPNGLQLNSLSFFCLLMLAVFVSAGCKKKAGVEIKNGTLVLRTADGKEQVADLKGKVYWLHQSEKEAKLTLLENVAEQNFSKFRGYVSSTELKDPFYSFSKGTDGEFKVVSETGQDWPLGKLGLLFTLKDGVVIMADFKKNECTPASLTVDKNSITRDGANEGKHIIYRSREVVNEDGLTVIERLIYSEARMAVGDTGTELVIIDNFKMAEAIDCCKESYLDCPQPDTTGEMADVSGVSLEGWTEDFKVHVENGCVWEFCHHVIIADKSTGAIKCYNTLLCDLRIQVWNDGTFIVLVEEGCDTASAVTICPGN